MKQKIYSELRQRKDFDSIPMKELQESIGWVEPKSNEAGKVEWTATLIGEGGFTTKSQEQAHIIASLEEVKALLLRHNQINQTQEEKQNDNNR